MNHRMRELEKRLELAGGTSKKVKEKQMTAKVGRRWRKSKKD
jgi:hypothetical protein